MISIKNLFTTNCSRLKIENEELKKENLFLQESLKDMKFRHQENINKVNKFYKTKLYELKNKNPKFSKGGIKSPTLL